MNDRLDDLLGQLASGPAFAEPDGVDAAVWRRVDARQAADRRLKSGVALQCAIGACALLVGFSYKAVQGAVPAPHAPEPFVKLLDGSRVAEAGSFQVLR